MARDPLRVGIREHRDSLSHVGASAEPGPAPPFVDLLLLAVVTAAAAGLWWQCSGTSELAGDSFVPLQCGRRYLIDGWALPSQNIFGWGLCATFAPFFWGAQSLAEVAGRRAFAASLVVPCVFLTCRWVLPSTTSLSLTATRAGAFCGAVAVLFAPGVGRPSSSGGHGYLAWTWIAICVAALAYAARAPTSGSTGRRVLDRSGRILATALGVGAVAIAAMNHPFAVWVGAAALVLLPLGVARAGILAVAAGIAVGWRLAAPRFALLRDKQASGDTFESFAHQPGSERLLDPAAALDWITTGQDTVLIWGFFVFVLVSIPLARGDRRRMAVATSWVLAAVAGIGALVVLGRRVGYLQDYHVMTAHPFGAMGIALVTGSLFDWTSRLAVPRLPPKLLAPVGALLIAAMGLVLAEASDLEEEGRAWSDPWCSVHPRDGGSTSGVRWYERAIRRDLAGPAAPDTFLLTDLNLGSRRVDGSVALALSLHMGGIPVERMTCCAAEDDAPQWYMIGELYDDRLDWNQILAVDGIDLLLRRQDVSELLFAVRTPEALAALGDILCAVISPDLEVNVHYYNEIADVLSVDRRALPFPPPSPTPLCLTRSR